MEKETFNRRKGAIFMMLSAFWFALMQIFVHLTGGTIPLMEQIFARNIVCAIWAYTMIKKDGKSVFGTKKDQPLLTVRSFFGFMGFICLFYASSHAQQADVTTLMKISPFLITLWAALFLHEKISKVQIPALLIAFGGCLFIANPTFSSNIFPLVVAAGCALFSSVSYTLLAYFKGKVDGMTIIMHFSTFSCLVSLPFMCVSFVMPTPLELLYLILIGACGAAGQYFLTYSYRLAPASEVSIYNYSGIIFSILLGFFCLGEIPGWNSIVGCGMVIIAAFLAYRFSRKTQ